MMDEYRLLMDAYKHQGGSEEPSGVPSPEPKAKKAKSPKKVVAADASPVAVPETVQIVAAPASPAKEELPAAVAIGSEENKEKKKKKKHKLAGESASCTEQEHADFAPSQTTAALPASSQPEPEAKKHKKKKHNSEQQFAAATLA